MSDLEPPAPLGPSPSAPGTSATDCMDEWHYIHGGGGGGEGCKHIVVARMLQLKKITKSCNL